MKTLRLETHQRAELLDITEAVQTALDGVGEGICLVVCPHTTAAITVNEGYDPAVAHDMLTAFDTLAPRQGDYRHAEGNSDAHIKVALVGPTMPLAVSGGRLALGRWQRLFFCEFDGPRRREVWVQIVAATNGSAA